MRFECKAPLEGISSNLCRLNHPNTSLGYISQNLSFIGDLLPNTIKISNEITIFATIAIDEIYSKKLPILISVDPKSSAILKIELAKDSSSQTWKNHLVALKKSIEIVGVVGDEGKGLSSGVEKALPHIVKQSDTYHAIAHKLGVLVNKLEKKAYSAIAKEIKCEEDFYKVKRDTVLETKFLSWQEACQKAQVAIELYENFKYLYNYTINQLKPFCKNGEIRAKLKAKEEIECAISLIESLNQKEINKKTKTIKKLLSSLLNYFDQTKKSVEYLKGKGIDEEALKQLCLGWQWHKSFIKAKVSNRKKEALMKEKSYLQKAQERLKDDYEKVKLEVFDELNKIIQASSMVENINSILRSYLDNSKNQINQEFLNFFMFYHNHRRYKNGERKGKTPMELLTNKVQTKDWIELLCENIQQKVPSFFD